ncbi:MAG: hypothetical protein J6T39_02315, partial [Clostridia bacterium]|nr:hypothetical protein [Clostridia bacterium]
MKKRIFSFLLAVFCLFTAGVFVAGCKNGYDPDQYKRVKIIMPEKVHVEYAGVIYVQDGNEVYAKASTVHSSDRLEVYAKLDLTNEVIFDQPQYSQGYITARLLNYGGSNFEWQCAENDTNYSSWHANDYNHGVYAKAESY